jgi:tetratricopeptide (TPR) repeat protein
VRVDKILIACLGLLAAPLALSASGAAPWPLPAELAVGLHYSTLEIRMFDRAQHGELRDAYLDAALIAGGVADESTRREYVNGYRTHAQRLLTMLAAPHDTQPEYSLRQGALNVSPAVNRLPSVANGSASPDPRRERAAAVFEFLHREILTGKYDLQCSRLAQVLDTGNYNCVTATILFNCLAAEAGLSACGGESPSHVVSLVRVPGQRLEIETTCPRWFERHDKERQIGPPGSQPVGGVQASAKRPMIRRELHAAELAAIVYYNIAVDLAEQRRYSEAVAANYKALELDGQCQNAEGNLLAAINNWALDLAEREQYAGAVELVRQGYRLAPHHRTFSLNHTAIHQRWIQRLCERGQLAQAEALVERAAQDFPDEPFFTSAREQIERQRQLGRSEPGHRISGPEGR